jgi:hypothetical protein
MGISQEEFNREIPMVNSPSGTRTISAPSMGETIVSGREPLADIFDMSQCFSNSEFSFHVYSIGKSSKKPRLRNLQKKRTESNPQYEFCNSQNTII